MILIISATLTGAVLAQPTGEAKDSPIKNVAGLIIVLNNIVKVLYQAFFIVAIGFIILAAFTYLTAKDDPEKIKSATKQILYATIAIAIALVSVGVSTIIFNFIKT